MAEERGYPYTGRNNHKIKGHWAWELLSMQDIEGNLKITLGNLSFSPPHSFYAYIYDNNNNNQCETHNYSNMS